jgi:hypothetical protein
MWVDLPFDRQSIWLAFDCRPEGPTWLVPPGEGGQQFGCPAGCGWPFSEPVPLDRADRLLPPPPGADIRPAAGPSRTRLPDSRADPGCRLGRRRKTSGRADRIGPVEPGRRLHASLPLYRADRSMARDSPVISRAWTGAGLADERVQRSSGGVLHLFRADLVTRKAFPPYSDPIFHPYFGAISAWPSKGHNARSLGGGRLDDQGVRPSRRPIGEVELCAAPSGPWSLSNRSRCYIP